MALLFCREVALSYEGAVAVSGISFELEAGAYLCIVGENGSGKSTLVKGVLGLLRPAAGSIDFGENLRPSQIGYLPQQAAAQRTFPASVTEVVLSGRLGVRRGGTRSGGGGARGDGSHSASIVRFSPFYSRADKQATAEALERLGIGALAHASFGELSGGQQQRVLLARAICAAADGLRLLVLDEPMSALDPHAKQELYALIAKLNAEQGITIVMVTHDVQAATAQASHILLLNQTQEFFGTAHAFMHTTLGQDLMRDSCAGQCAVCGLNLSGADGRGHAH